MTDARFEDARETPLYLGAMDATDLEVLSSLAQDAIFPITEMKYDRAKQTFAMLLNRFRWEEGPARKMAPERVQSVLLFENVGTVASQGVDRSDKDTVLSLLSVTFEEDDAPSGHIVLTLAGDGAIRLGVEALQASLKDVTKPYLAPSKQAPKHPE
ncbi:MAG: DUF2948 family protein [Roseobacter sp.]